MRDYSLSISETYDRNNQHIVALFAVQLDDRLSRLKKAVQGLTTEQLEWQLQTGMNTVGMLLAHIAVAETFWINIAPKEIPWETEGEKLIRQIIGIKGSDDGVPLKPDGHHPAPLQGKKLSDYLKMLDKCRQTTHSVLQDWLDSDLEKSYTLENNSFTYSWTLYHVLEHLVSHFGQILLLKHIMRDKGVLKETENDAG